jgi:Tol biopolymer transport system component
VTDQRWHEIERLYHAAVERPPETRAAFLSQACRDDRALRDEIQALLAREQAAERFLELPAIERTGALAPGDTIGSCTVRERIGAGGMGDVYRAHDVALGRDVAIKVLLPAFLANPDRLARFEREARVLAALNHPHIGGIYAFERTPHGGALILELVEGPTLADEIARTAADGHGLPIAQCLAIARQLADALDAAHEKGIVHRDLKPSNIKLSSAGQIKVIDFGLAKADTAREDGEPASTLTIRGVVMGTAAYMSPEQARGKTVDRRTDIWSFGCVLYEMLVGRAPFKGQTTSDTLAAVLRSDPDWAALPAATPAPTRLLLRRCLEKDPAQRLRDIGDARFDLESQPASEAGAPPPLRPGMTPARAIGAALLVGAAAAGGALWRGRAADPAPAPETAPIEFRFPAPANQSVYGGLAISRDGRRVAFSTLGRLWVRSLETGEVREVVGGENGTWPFWSPDGSALGFVQGTELKKLALDSGAVVRIGSRPTAIHLGATWGANDTILIASGGGLYTVPASGGTVSPLGTPAEPGHAVRSRPCFLPGGRRFLYHEQTRNHGAIFAGTLGSPEVTRIVDAASGAEYVAPGYLLFMRGTALVAQQFDHQTLARSGAPVAVVADISPGFLDGWIQFSASDTGVLTYGLPRQGVPGALRWFDRDGTASTWLPQLEGTELLNPMFAPGGDRIAMNAIAPAQGTSDIWIHDLARDVRSQVTLDAAQDADPVWSPDGREIVFVSNRSGRMALYRKAVDGTRPEERLHEFAAEAASVVPTDWTSDGKHIVFSVSSNPPGGWRIWVLPLSPGAKPARVLPELEINQYGGRVSPDGRWIAYTAIDGAHLALFVQPFLESGQRTRISRAGGTHPRWVAAGRELVFWAWPGGIMSVGIGHAPTGFVAGVPRPLVSTPVLDLIDGRPHYDITRDGRRLLLRQQSGASEGAIAVVANWPARLTQNRR